jgi:CheY-specific phosphatase CheX
MMRESDQLRDVAAPGSSEPACEAAALEVLETMFFELPLGEPEMMDQPPEQPVAATAEFNGDLRGSLSVASEPWAARRLAANFLGREDESTITETEVRLVTCELANMVCGNALSRIEPHGRFQISTPEAALPCEAGLDWLTFVLESGAVAVCLNIEGR